VIKSFQQTLDRMAITAATASVHSGWKKPGQRERAEAILAEASFLAPPMPAAQLTFHSKSRFTFPSVVRHSWDTPTAPGRLRRAGEDWQKRPAVILIHGWNGELGYYLGFPLIERALAMNGINALAFELPFHGRRRPRVPGEINNLISDDLATMVEGMRHCLADVLSLRWWLLEQGCPSVSLWGYSLGGWLTGLLSAHPDPFAASVLMSPVARMDIAMATLPFAAPFREATLEEPFDLSKLNLGATKPTVKDALILGGIRDLFVPTETLEALARQWPRAEFWPLRHSHISIVFGLITISRAVKWLRSRICHEH
jgi:pimeloyl-ACP methyl ester carboxylesterase